MPKLFSSFLIFFLFIGVWNSTSQNEVEFKEVILNGKPGKLNIKTGEISLIKPNQQDQPVKLKEELASSVVIDSSVNRYHVVKKNESLFDIATTYEKPLLYLRDINGLETTLVKEGQVLKIDTPNLKSGDIIENKLHEVKGKAPKYHIVQKGETLYSLSRKYQITLEELKSNNGLTSNLIKVGQKLKVAINILLSSSKSLDRIIVVKGDTLFSLAKKHNTSVIELKRLNGLKNNLIITGQELRIK